MTTNRVGIFVYGSVLPDRGGGLERVMVDIANGLESRGHEVDLITSEFSDSYWRSIGISDSVLIYPLITNCYYRAPLSLNRYVRERRPTVILSTELASNFTTLITKALLIPRLRVVLHQTNPLRVVSRPGKWYRIRENIIKCLMPLAYRVIALNYGMMDEIKRSTFGTKIQIIPDPLDYDNVMAESKKLVDHPWLQDECEFLTILTVTRLVRMKDVQTLLKSFAIVLAQRDVRLIIAGNGPELPNLISLANRLGITDFVDFVGFQDNPFPYMANSDLFAISSTSEGFCTVITQSLACGTPVVSTDCKFGPPEILGHGKFGNLAPVGDPKGMADAMINMLDQPTPDAVMKEAIQPYLLDQILDQYEIALGLINDKA